MRVVGRGKAGEVLVKATLAEQRDGEDGESADEPDPEEENASREDGRRFRKATDGFNHRHLRLS